MRADLERAAAAFRELGDDWALGDDAVLAVQHADAGRRPRRRRDRARRGDRAARDAHRLRPAPRCCGCGWPRSACAAATSTAPASSSLRVVEQTPTCAATRACSSARRSPASRWLAGDIDELRRAGRRRERRGSSGIGADARREQGHARAFVQRADRAAGDRGRRPRRPPRRRSTRPSHWRWRRPTCRSSPSWGRRGGAVRALRARRGRRRAARRLRRAARGGGPLQPRGGAAATRRSRGFEAAYERGRGAGPRRPPSPRLASRAPAVGP